MQLTAYLTFDGRCNEAFRFYERCLGGKIETMQTHGDSPIAAQVPESWHKAILHARLVVGDAVLMGSDAPPNNFMKPQGMAVSIQDIDPASAERIFAELAQDGTVQMPMSETFWAVRFGMCVDRFGIPWIVNCDRSA